MIKLLNVHKYFGHLYVLKGVSLEIKKNEVVAIIGPSGSGKSTLLRCINALEPIQNGEIWIDGELVNFHDGKRVRKVRQKIGIVFQSFNLFPHLTVEKNITLALRHVRKIPEKKAKDIAHSFLRKLGLEDKASTFPDNLSGGQQQRVAIVRALAMEPKAMLFDEVTSALDPELIGEVLEVMRDLAREGMTMAVVSHELEFVKEAASRVVFMDGGTIVEEGSCQKIFNNPESERVKAFLKKII
ncbi:amino acid ABC transporter ATP-binding protein [Candidatus Aerophobetes bacterium]|uniref:Amino acid ABC transporter ATP-binding protein n=1 Tax=Aerophobetes bacterium TaxID=2030807 RepID=A0A523RTA0_UNCAE|nr:MAG: amino acid ABC transporter ATP-binding protein [Candidatus Aerophobetes bacterium]